MPTLICFFSLLSLQNWRSREMSAPLPNAWFCERSECEE